MYRMTDGVGCWIKTNRTVNFQWRVIMARSIQSISVAFKDIKVRVLNVGRIAMTQSDWFLMPAGERHDSFWVVVSETYVTQFHEYYLPTNSNRSAHYKNFRYLRIF